MKTLLAAFLLLSPSLVLAADDVAPGGVVVQPAVAQPSLSPPAPPENPAPPPEQTATTDEASASGQWVYTGQYGWVWMPYGDAYTYQPTDGGSPDMYVYYPTVGWTWVVAPWIYGWGPQPFFGLYGTARFGWFGSGFGRWAGFRGPFANFNGRGIWSGGRWSGGLGRGSSVPFHPAGPRSGFAAPRSGFVTARGGFAAPRSGFAAPRGGFAAPRGGFGGGASFGGRPGGSFGGHPAGGFGGHGGGGGGGHGGGGHR